MPRSPAFELALRHVATAPASPGVERVLLETHRGTVECRLHDAPAGDAAVLWVFGAGGGLGGPAGGVYDRLGGRLAPRPLLIAHGAADEVLPDRRSRDIYARAGEPKRLILYPGCRHGLDACRDAVDCDLTEWLREVTGLPTGAGGVA